MTPRERARNRARERLEALADAGLDAEQRRLAAIEALRPAVGFERWCWPLTDPSSALSTSGIAEFDLWDEVPRLAALEEYGDVTSKARLATGARASVALSVATRGDLSRSPRWRECLRPYGVGDELMTVCRDRHGCWGSVELMRDEGDRPFDEEDIRLLDGIAPTLGRLLRRSHPHGPWTEPREVRLPLAATLILDRDLRPASWTPSFREWLTELTPAELDDGAQRLPPAIYELGARVLTPTQEATGLPPRVRIRTRTGRWATLEAGPLEGDDHGRVVIGVREASPDEAFDLLCRTYALSRRERQLVAFVLDGLATKQLAQALCISPYTVQDHLKAIFAKTGVRTRGELISHLGGRARATRPG